MLLQLRISHFAVIEECRIELDSGLIALTGETGAGKSILIDALSGCLGARMGADVVRTGADKAEIEAVFTRNTKADEVATALAEAGIEDEDPLILSREISRSGRTIGRVNGRAVPVSVLTAVGGHLVDLHGQSEHLSLLKASRQLDMLDHFGKLDAERKTFAIAAAELGEARTRLRELESNRRSAEQRLDLLRFQVKEIEDADLKAGEIESLNEERVRLANSEKLAVLSTDGLRALDGDETVQAAADQLAILSATLRQLSAIDRSMDATRERADELVYGLGDLAANLRAYRESIEFDPVRLDAVETRLDQIIRICRKYGDTIDEVLAVLASAKTEVDAVENYETRLAEAGQVERELEEHAGRLALSLSHGRATAAVRFVKQVRERLARLGLGPALFEIRLERTPADDGIPIESADGVERIAYTASGIDRIQFFVAFNAGEPLKPIERVASGGETARFMLAVKAVLAGADDVPTLIFDEIDTGVGGRGGPVVAAMLGELAGSHQVISITHLAQIAAEAGQHLKVLKQESEDVTSVRVQKLDGEDRVRELAEMLSGSPASAPALKTAEELLTAHAN